MVQNRFFFSSHCLNNEESEIRNETSLITPSTRFHADRSLLYALTSMSAHRVSTGKSSPEYSESEISAVEEIDFTQNAELYFSTIAKLQKHAIKVRQHDIDREKILMEYLPVNEKFNLNKEGKVLTRWQERQRDWERIQASISRKLNSKTTRPLMMTTTDEYRAKIEEYDLIQAALPLKDRYSESSWQMTLRGGGPVCIAIGHIFSGIECKFDVEVPKPKMIRKPKSVEATFKNDTFLERTDAYIKKRKKYEKSITEIRPHDLTYRDASNLVVKSSSLFAWAKESSAQYFKEQEEDELSVIREEDNRSVGDLRSTHSVGSTQSLGRGIDSVEAGPRIELLSSREVVFESLVDQECRRSVVFRNIGTLAISYRWRKINLERSDKDKKKRGSSVASQADIFSRGLSFGAIVAAKGEDEGRLRSHVLSVKRDSFFCLRDAGEILPDEEVSTVFVFSSRAGPGVFRGDWVLEFTPLDSSITLSAPAELTGNCAGNPPRLVGSVGVKLRGHCVEHDESQSKRRFVASHLNDCAAQAMAFDVVHDCLRRVRDPVRLDTIHCRQIALFKSVNKTILDGLSARHGVHMPLFLTPQRLELFADLHQQSVEHHSNVLSTLYSLQEQDSGVGSELDIVSPFTLDDYAAQKLRATLFPERVIEIFDEVVEEQLVPSWDMDLSILLAGLRSLLGIVAEVEELEARILMRTIAEGKALAKAEKKAARKAANGNDSDEDDDDDDDDDEDGEEEEDGEDGGKTKPQHSLHVQTQGLIDAVLGTVNLLVTRPVDAQQLFDITKSHVASVMENFDDWRTAALADAGIVDLVSNGAVIPQLPSPFTSREGANAWAHALKQTSAIAEPVAPVKGAPKQPKNAPPPTTATAQQVDFFYRQLYNSVRSGILDMTESIFADIDVSFNNAIRQEPPTGDKLSDTALLDVAVSREEDFAAAEDGRGTVAFLSFDGDAFTCAHRAASAFDLASRNKEQALQPICRLLEQGVKAVILLYDPCKNAHDDTNAAERDVLLSLAEIQALVSKRYEEFVLSSNRAQKKAKQPLRQFRTVKFYASQSFAELNCQLDNLLRYGEMVVSVGKSHHKEDRAQQFFASTIPVILLQNVAFPGVVPLEPPYVEAESDDDEAPLPVGQEEFRAQQRAKWIARRPHRVTVEVSMGPATKKKTLAVECYADAGSATRELVSLATNHGDGIEWIDSVGSLAFPAIDCGAFSKLSPVVEKRMVSEHLRECCVWMGVLRHLPHFLETVNSEYSDTMFSEHMRRLFPYSALHQSKPTSLAVIGGSVQNDKFRVLDQLLDTMDSVVVVGEMALPFIGLSRNITLAKHRSLCAIHRAACIQLLQKARLRGCPLTWPCDVVQGDEEVTLADRRRCSEKVEPDARADGGDYEGELRTVNLAAAMAGEDISDDFVLGGETGMQAGVASSTCSVVVDGYVYDIGPQTSAALKSMVTAADIVLVWGTVGVCEMSSFQAGQLSLVEAAAHKVTDDSNDTTTAPADQLTRNLRQTLLLGDSCVEWFTRVVDSDGELGGDLVAAGAIAYAERNSAVPVGLLGRVPSQQALSNDTTKLRPTTATEWVYSKRVLAADDEEEDEDEED